MPFIETNIEEVSYPNNIIWSNRKLLSDASQRSIPVIGKYDGACWEYVIEIAKIIHKKNTI